MAGAYVTGTPPNGPFTPYYYGPYPQNQIYHFDPQPAGGYPTGGAAALIFSHGGSFVSGNSSQSTFALLATGYPSTAWIAVNSDSYPIHVFQINTRLARQTPSQTFNKNQYPTRTCDLYDSVYDYQMAIRFIREHAAELNVNPNLIAAGGNSAGSMIGACAFYHPDAGRFANAQGRFGPRFNARPNIILLQNTPLIPEIMTGASGMDGCFLTGHFATDTNERNDRWSRMRRAIDDLSPFQNARYAFENEGYAPRVCTIYDNNEFQATLDPSIGGADEFSQTTAHTAICGYHFHKMLDEDLGYGDAKTRHLMGWTNKVPSGATQTWADYVWASDTAWSLSTSYTVGQMLAVGATRYVCKTSHTSTAATEPGVGINWTVYWDAYTTVEVLEEMYNWLVAAYDALGYAP